MINFFGSIKSYYTNSFNFSGRATRLEYFYSWLFFVLLYFLLNALRFVMVNRESFVSSNNILFIIAIFIISFPFVSLIARRLQDINLSGWWSLLVIAIIVPTTLLYPLIGSILLLCGLILKGPLTYK